MPRAPKKDRSGRRLQEGAEDAASVRWERASPIRWAFSRDLKGVTGMPFTYLEEERSRQKLTANQRPSGGMVLGVLVDLCG